MLPHYLQRVHAPLPDDFDNAVIRPGEVIEVIWPEDQRSRSRKWVEYNVQVQHRDIVTDTSCARLYRATRANFLGGYTDRERLNYRSDTPGRDGIGKGSKVLIACLSGEHNAAIILGGLRDQRDSDLGLRDSDIYYDWEINGCQLLVRRDGSARWLRLGPRDLDGKVSDTPKRVGSWSVGKDGTTQLGIQDGSSGDPDQYMRLDASDDRAKVVARDGLHVGRATDAPLLGTTYRNQERSLHETMVSSLQQIQAAASTAAAALSSASTAILVPTTGAVACSGPLAAAASGLGQVATAAATLAAAIRQFEAASTSYLSEKNRSD